MPHETPVCTQLTPVFSALSWIWAIANGLSKNPSGYMLADVELVSGRYALLYFPFADLSTDGHFLVVSGIQDQGCARVFTGRISFLLGRCVS